MNKKAGAGLIIGIVVGIVLLASAIVTLAVLNQKGYFNKPEVQQNPTLLLYLKSMERDTTNQLEASYIAQSGNSVISKGTTKKDGWIELDVPSNKQLTISCWDENHYLVKAFKEFSGTDIELNKSTFSCDSVKIGKVSLSYLGSLQPDESSITLNISSSDWLYHPLVLASWTGGINSISLPQQNVRCDEGSWVNWTSYDAVNRKYTYLQNGYYKCGEMTENCEAVSGNYCRAKLGEIPRKYKNKADSAFYLGGSIFNTSQSITFEIRSASFLNSLDSVTFIVLDSDRRFNEQTGDYDWVTEDNVGIDLGAETQEINIPYKAS